MAKSALAVIDAAVAEVVNAQRATWFERLPDDARETLVAARAKFHAGGYGTLKRTTLCRILIQHATKQGWKVPKLKGMSEWLAKHD
jgi:hypothetical protein